MDVVINYKNWVWVTVWVASTSFPRLFPSRRGAGRGRGHPSRQGKSPGNEVGVACGLCVNKMADATLSSDEEIENPIETAVSKGALLHLLSNFL